MSGQTPRTPAQVIPLRPARPVGQGSAIQLFLALLLVGVFAISLLKPHYSGDAAEYTLTTIALAEHATPEIRASDVALARRLLPEYGWFHDRIEAHLGAGGALPPGFLRGADGQVHAIHYFGYSLLAALPFKLAQHLGGNPMKCFMWLDWAMLLVLFHCACHYLARPGRALAAVGAFVLTVGLPYWNWSSPEFFSSAAALSALFLMGASASPWAGVLLGLAAMQNPPLLALLFLGPVLCEANPRRWRSIALGTVLGLGIGLLPIVFSFRFFDTWNVIATGATDPRLISALRLLSYYIDLNQGMLVAIPAVWLAILWGLAKQPKEAIRLLPLAAASLLLALPALSTQNWNSGSAGMMRYVAWGSMPFLFLMFALLRGWRAWPPTLIALFVLVQAACVAQARHTSHIEFAPLARWVLDTAPSLYNPEPEIFIDRSSKAEPMIDYDQVYAYGEGSTRKTLYHSGSYPAIAKLCPAGLPQAPSVVRASYDGWTYLNGPVSCAGQLALHAFGATGFQAAGAVRLGKGWSQIEFGAPADSGVWSVGAASTVTIQAPPGTLDAVSIRGLYMMGNTSTKVTINGVAAGSWHLDRPNRIALPVAVPNGVIEIGLTHQAPRQPSAQDTRLLAFFMKQVVVSTR